MITHSATLAANERIRSRIEAGQDIVHLAFGEAGLPLHPRLAERLYSAAPRTDYPSVVGDHSARTAGAGYFERRGMATDPSQVVLGPGSKALLYALLLALPGDVVLPQPSWVSYAAQAALAGRGSLLVPIGERSGGLPDPDLLHRALTHAREQGRDVRSLVITRPDNPTGTIAEDSILKRVCDIAVRHGLIIISDEIYADLSHDVGAPYPLSAATLAPAHTIVTTGLSKRLALGGWRIGVARIPYGDLQEQLTTDITAIGSEIWSAMPGPMQEVARFAFDEPQELSDYISQARRLHGCVANAMWRVWTEAGATCRRPQGGFYLYPDLAALAEPLRKHGVTTSSELAQRLLDVGQIGVLPGEAFGDDPARLTVRVATSLLYGRTPEQRREALESSTPTELPWIRRSLERVAEGLDVTLNRM